MSKTIELDTKTQELYWSKLTQFKFDLLYLSCVFSSCVKMMRFIRIGTAAVTALTTGAWMAWNSIPFVGLICGIAIVVLQVFSACAELFPYDKRKQEIRELQNLLDPLYNAMEKDWCKIADGQFTKEEICNITYTYSAKRQEIQQHFFKDDSLPIKKRFENKVNKETTEYFENFIC